MAQAQERTAVRAKKRFHHGDLREALIAATRDLLIEHGPDGFTLADACRRVHCLLNPAPPLGVGGDLGWERADSDQAVALGVSRPVDFTCRAFTEARQDFVMQ